MKQRILFICTGNTCRSPLAQGLATKLFKGLEVEFQSAGMHAWEGDQASPQVIELLKQEGVDLSFHQARRLPGLLDEYNWIVPMTKSQEQLLLEQYPDLRNKIRRLGSWGGHNEDVADPYGGSMQTYLKTASHIKRLLGAMKEELFD